MDNDIKLDMEQRARASEIEEMVIDDPEWAASAIVWQRDQLAAAEAREESLRQIVGRLALALIAGGVPRDDVERITGLRAEGGE